MKKTRGYPKQKPWVRGMHAEQKISVARGFGPTHAENAQEGGEADPSSPAWNEAKFGVDAKLTPHEAVLNRNAAVLAGRGNIEHLNEQGNKLAHKGIDLAGGTTMKPKKYQAGTKNTDPYVKGPDTDPYKMSGGGDYTLPIGQLPVPPEQQYTAPIGMRPVPQASPPIGMLPISKPASFYPPKPGEPIQAQGGLENVEQIGKPQAGYPWQMVPLTSGQLSALQKEMEKQGLNKDQIAGLSQAFKGFGGGGGQASPGAGAYSAAGSPTMVYGASGYPSAIPVGGYQGGISDIGYPPFVAPTAEYHADKGSTWVGPFDPAYMIPRY